MTGQVDDTALMRLVDGEATARERADIEAAAATDPALAARLSALRMSDRRLRDAFPAATDPRDADLARLVAASSDARKTPSAWSRISGVLAPAFAPRPIAVWGALAAAAFVAGVVVAPMLDQQRTYPGTFAVADGGRIADVEAVQALDRRLAAEGRDARGYAVGLTFRDTDGRWCRTFSAARSGVAGLACRQDDDWGLVALSPFDGPTSEVRTAAADTPQVILDAVDARLSGETADAAAETQARDAGWRQAPVG